jgi:predicted AlkP superfamily phosphohydrolase/phosphomutase
MPVTENASPKVLMIGLDAVDIDYLRDNLDRLPNLRRLFAEGPLRRPSSTATVLAGSVWPTLCTGRSPGEHGIYYPMQWDAAAMQLRRLSPDWLPARPFWCDLDEAGIPVTVADIPICYPNPLRCGMEVLNWSAQENLGALHATRPEIAGEIKRRFGKYPLGDDIPVQKSRRQLDEIRRDLLTGIRRKTDLSLWLMRNTQWRLFVTVFAEGHRAGHSFWPDPDGVPSTVPEGSLLEIHRALDDSVGELIAATDLDRTMVVVFSPYGMGPNNSQAHFMPAIIDRLNPAFAGSGAKAAAPQRSLMRSLRERLPAGLQYAIARRVSSEIRDRVTKRAFAGHEWGRTPGFAMLSGGEGFIRCNIAGREREGVLPQGSEAHARYVAVARECLLSLRLPDDTPLVDDVVLPAERFPGSRSQLLPDIVALWTQRAPAAEIRSERLGAFAAPLGSGRGGNHRPDGFLVAAGANRQAAASMPLRETTDFAPLIRGLVGAGVEHRSAAVP